MRRFRKTRRFVRERLPDLNGRTESGQDLRVITRLARKEVKRLRTATHDTHGGLERLGQREARHALQLLDFIVGSIERHHQSAGHGAGSGLGSLPGAEQLMLDLGRAAQHPPKGSAYTRWVWNDDELSFTGDEQEHLFDDVVRATHDLLESAGGALRRVVHGEARLSSRSGWDALEYAANRVQRCHEEYKRLKARKSGDDNAPAFSPRFFATRMRLYLPTYAIAGTVWDGVSAANLTAFWSVDFLIGCVSGARDYSVGGARHGTYADLVTHKAVNVPREEQVLLSADMEAGSVLDHILRELALNPRDLPNHDEAHLARLLAMRPALLNALPAFERMMAAWGSLSGYHLALIKSHLTKVAEGLSPEELESLGVPPDRGSGGLDLSEVRAITMMRQRHPVLRPLLAAVRRLAMNKVA